MILFHFSRDTVHFIALVTVVLQPLKIFKSNFI